MNGRSRQLPTKTSKMPDFDSTYSLDLDEEELRRILEESDDNDEGHIGELTDEDLEYLK